MGTLRLHALDAFIHSGVYTHPEEDVCSIRDVPVGPRVKLPQFHPNGSETAVTRKHGQEVSYPTASCRRNLVVLMSIKGRKQIIMWEGPAGHPEKGEEADHHVRTDRYATSVSQIYKGYESNRPQPACSMMRISPLAIPANRL